MTVLAWGVHAQKETWLLFALCSQLVIQFKQPAVPTYSTCDECLH